jgi:hypothetical protein
MNRCEARDAVIFGVVRRNPGADAMPIFGGLLVVSSSDAVDRVIERTPNDARYFAGFYKTTRPADSRS